MRLIDRLEREVPKCVGKAKSHFIIAPLAFVPLAALSKRGFFYIEKELNEARFCVIYRAWRTIVKEIYNTLHYLIEQPLPIKLLIDLIMFLGGKIILKKIEKYGRKRGFDIDKCLTCT